MACGLRRRGIIHAHDKRNLEVKMNMRASRDLRTENHCMCTLIARLLPIPPGVSQSKFGDCFFHQNTAPPEKDTPKPTQFHVRLCMGLVMSQNTLTR